MGGILLFPKNYWRNKTNQFVKLWRSRIRTLQNMANLLNPIIYLYKI